MRKFIQFGFLAIMLFTFNQTSFAVRTITQTENLSLFQEKFGVSNLDGFLDLNVKDVEEFTGEKMRLRDKIILKTTQKRVEWRVKKGKEVDAEQMYAAFVDNFSLIGFLLGFFLSLIGVLISLLLGRDAFRSSIIGLLCGLLIVFLGFTVL